MKLFNNYKDRSIVKGSVLFNEEWYLKNNPDVEKSGMDPITHFLRYGGFEKRNPGPFFCTAWYLKTYPDVQKSGMNPLVHFMKYGILEDKKPNPYNLDVFTSYTKRQIKKEKQDAENERRKFTNAQKESHYKEEFEKFDKYQGYSLNLENPKTFNEKLVWKKLYDRNPLLPVVADKLLVREYVKQKLGKELAAQMLIPLLFSTNDPEVIPFEELPRQYIIKTNHGSNQNIIVKDNENLSQEQKTKIIVKCIKWLSQPYGFLMNEWAYQDIKPHILVEKLMLDKNNDVPKDYKLFIINGKCRMIQVDFDRFTGHKRSMFDENWNYLDLIYKYPKGPDAPKPESFSFMKEIAEKLGQDFDFIRVDLYEIDGRVYFGELTHYPEAATGFFDPREYDDKLGDLWQLKPRYWAH